jgi:hypothetical protein
MRPLKRSMSTRPSAVAANRAGHTEIVAYPDDGLGLARRVGGSARALAEAEAEKPSPGRRPGATSRRNSRSERPGSPRRVATSSACLLSQVNSSERPLPGPGCS